MSKDNKGSNNTPFETKPPKPILKANTANQSTQVRNAQTASESKHIFSKESSSKNNSKK